MVVNMCDLVMSKNEGDGVSPRRFIKNVNEGDSVSPNSCVDDLNEGYYFSSVTMYCPVDSGSNKCECN